MPYLCFDGLAVKIDHDLAAKMPSVLRSLSEGQYPFFEQEIGSKGSRIHLTGAVAVAIAPDDLDVSKLTVID